MGEIGRANSRFPCANPLGWLVAYSLSTARDSRDRDERRTISALWNVGRGNIDYRALSKGISLPTNDDRTSSKCPPHFSRRMHKFRLPLVGDFHPRGNPWSLPVCGNKEQPRLRPGSSRLVSRKIPVEQFRNARVAFPFSPPSFESREWIRCSAVVTQRKWNEIPFGSRKYIRLSRNLEAPRRVGAELRQEYGLRARLRRSRDKIILGKFESRGEDYQTDNAKLRG